ncbi:MAG: hypothetical protein ACO1N9_06585 [Flavobacterium sp.]
MRFKNFLSKLNWKQIIIHMIAAWFLFGTLHQFYSLYRIDLLEGYKDGGMKFLSDNANEVNYYIFYLSLSGLVAALITLFISIILSIKKGWHWINSVLSFVIIMILKRVDLDYIERILFYPGWQFKSLRIGFVVNGLIMLSVSLFLFFSPIVQRFISGKKITTSPSSL